MATMSARYTVIDGEVVAQERGGVRHQLVPDPLGSTVALYDSVGTKTDTFGYWPYGESSSRTGATVMKFQYIGNSGYYQDNSIKNYVRARYVDSVKTKWITEDPIGHLVDINLLLYCNNNPVTMQDSSGLGASPPLYVPDPKKNPGLLRELCNNIAACSRNKGDFLGFYGQVKYDGPWDYKTRCPGKKMEDFGNYNYGAAGAACGFSLPRLLNEAGAAQCRHGSFPSLGKPGSMIGLNDGVWPFGDDPRDSTLIELGYQFYQMLAKTNFALCKKDNPLWPGTPYNRLRDMRGRYIPDPNFGVTPPCPYDPRAKWY